MHASHASHASHHVRPTPALHMLLLVTVFTTPDLIQAQTIQNALQDEGIRCFLEGEDQAGQAAAMDIEIQVPVQDADFARQLIHARERG